MSLSKEWAQSHCVTCNAEVDNPELDIPAFCSDKCQAEYLAKYPDDDDGGAMCMVSEEELRGIAIDLQAHGYAEDSEMVERVRRFASSQLYHALPADNPSLGEMLFALESTKRGIILRVVPQDSAAACNVFLGYDGDPFSPGPQTSLISAIIKAYEDLKR